MNPATDSAHRGPRHKVELKSSRTVELPCAITQQNTMAALFAAPSAELKKLLPSPRLKLVETHPGSSLLCVACTDYARVDGLEPYLEVALLVPVRYGARLSVPLLPLLAPQLFSDAGYYVHRTFVSTPEARDVAVEVHGARCELADIHFDEQPFWRRCIVQLEGKELLSLDVRKAEGRGFSLTTYTYTLPEGQILRRPVPLTGEVGFRRGNGGAKLELGEHYMANELRALKLSATPLVATHAPLLQSLLAAPDRTLAP